MSPWTPWTHAIRADELVRLVSERIENDYDELRPIDQAQLELAVAHALSALALFVTETSRDA